MRKLQTLLMILLLGLIIVSCEKEEEVILDGVGDVYIMSKVVDGETLYAPVFLAVASNATETVIVYKGDDKSNAITLSRYLGYSYAFKWMPSDDDYTNELPESGTYTFEITDIGGNTIEVTDELGSTELPDLSIEEITMINEGLYRIEWDDVEGAESYIINGYDENGELVLRTEERTPLRTEYLLSQYSDSWLLYPEDGDICNIVVWAVLYEENLSYPTRYHKQFVATASQVIEWGY